MTILRFSLRGLVAVSAVVALAWTLFYGLDDGLPIFAVAGLAMAASKDVGQASKSKLA